MLEVDVVAVQACQLAASESGGDDTLTGFAPTDPNPSGTVWFDDIWMW